ncbi:MAG: diaminobutyrate acetyltransferase [Gammaproteobacteria bacterium SHHR-1]|uniref:diaminobutyrate acetyltransferase n=1 Tax=Magnetovirga frankeli TaxID=947516 RepID=UPI001293375B|nr:diaminobutyrate acetyltransferase [gamma proteobacterium SS-5]
MNINTKPISYRRPALADGARVWQAIKQAGTLDLNSSYLYLLLCDQFAETCILAEMEAELVGFVTAFLRPDRPRTLFVWQVGVLPQARGRGVAKTMLQELTRRSACADLEWIEATVGPSNQASRALFAGLARDLGVELHEQPYMAQEHFPPGGGHEPEPLLRLGPLPR